MTRAKRSNTRGSIRRNRTKAAVAKKHARTRTWWSMAGRFLALTALVPLLGVTAIFAYDVITQCDYFQADRIAVEGIDRITRDEVLRQARIAPGLNILGVNLGLARKRLMGLDWVADAVVSRELPNHLTVRIREHQALAVIDTGRQFLVSRGRRIFAERHGKEGGDLPVITGLRYRDIGSVKIDSASLLGAALDVIEAAPAQLPDGGRVTRVHVDADMGLSLDTTGHFRRIFLGFGDVKTKLAYLKPVYRYEEAHGGMRPVANLRLDHLPRIVMRPMPPTSEEEQSKEA